MPRLISRRRNARWDQNDHALLWLMIPHVASHNVLQTNRRITLFIFEKNHQRLEGSIEINMRLPSP